jgi:peptide/nickel transport system substrate-binding protein
LFHAFRPRKAPSRATRWGLCLIACTLLASSCGGDSGSSDDAAKRVRKDVNVETGLTEAGDPVRGGRIVYGVEAETTGGFCLPEAQLGPAGNVIRNALYDSLTYLDENAQPKPYLAKSFTHDEAYQRWTFVLREGVTFHNGTPLDAKVVKNNLDAFIGEYPTRAGTLFPIVLSNIDEVIEVDDMTVEITTETPWPALPVYLEMLGIMAQEQLDDEETCESNMIGTGPFELSTWKMNQELLAQRNPDYWQIAPDGKSYPYADGIAFRPFPDTQQGMNALASGEINVLSTSATPDIYGPLTDMKESGAINMLVSADHAETWYILLNTSKAPFDDERMRRALATGIDRAELNELADQGFGLIADQPFPEGDMGYVDDPGFPAFDAAEAKRLVDDYVASGNKAEITLHGTFDPTALTKVEVIKNMLGKIGIDVKIRTIDQATVINEVLAGNFQATMWRQHAGGEPDQQYIWWYGGAGANPTNFSRINDPVINEALEQGRVETDPVKRKEIYERIPRRFAEKVYSIWLTYAEWGIGLAKNVHGVLSAELPDDGGPVFTGIAGGHPVHAMWVDAEE